MFVYVWPTARVTVECLTLYLRSKVEFGERSATFVHSSVVWPAAGALARTCGATAAEPGT